MRDDNSQQQQEQEEQQWKEIQEELERYIPFKADFLKFVESHERNDKDEQVRNNARS